MKSYLLPILTAFYVALTPKIAKAEDSLLKEFSKLKELTFTFVYEQNREPDTTGNTNNKKEIIDTTQIVLYKGKQIGEINKNQTRMALGTPSDVRGTDSLIVYHQEGYTLSNGIGYLWSSWASSGITRDSTSLNKEQNKKQWEKLEKLITDAFMAN